MSTSKKKSHTTSQLSDGTKIKEYETEETHPDGTKVITTTKVKTYVKMRTLGDGTRIRENITSTMTTTRECIKLERGPLVVDAAMNAVSGLVDMFTPRVSCNGNDNREDDREDADLDDFDRFDDDQSKATALTKDAPNQNDDVSTLGGFTLDSRLSMDSSKIIVQEKHNKAHEKKVHKVQVQVQQDRSKTPVQKDRAKTPLPKENAQEVHQQQRPQSQPQPQSQPLPTMVKTPSGGFFQKTHPTHLNHNNNNNNDQNNIMNNTPNPNNNNNNNNDDDDDETDCGSVGTASFMLYETDRCEKLPTFHKVVPPPTPTTQMQSRMKQQSQSERGRRSVGRSIIRSMTPTRTYSNSSNAKDVNKNIKLGLSSNRNVKNNKNSKSKNNKNDPNVLDPDVANAIDLIRSRSKSPVGGRRRRNSAILMQQQHQQQQMIMQQQQQGQQQISPGQQMFTNQPPPTMTGGVPQQQPNNAFYNNNSPGGGLSSPGGQFQQHPHESSLLRAMNYSSPGGQYQQSSPNNNNNNNHPYSAGGPLPVPASPGHPLGHLANPIQWDQDEVSDMRDDRPTMGSPQGGGGGIMPVHASPGVNGPSSPGDPPAPGRQKARTVRETKPKKNNDKRNKSTSKQKQQSNSRAAAGTTKQTTGARTSPPATLVKHDQVLLPPDSQAYIAMPKITIHKSNAVLTSDKFVHFYSFIQNQWVQTTTVSLQNTHGLSLALSDNTAVIGVPFDRNSKGMITGSAYIFERDSKTHTWYQVKKIVPKKVQEYATVGYSVDICDNVVAIGVPELGTSSSAPGGSGSVYVYQRAEQFKWVPMGQLTVDNVNNLGGAGGLMVPPSRNFGTIVALRGSILVVSNYKSNDGYSGETSVFVYEYDPTLKNKWKLIQTDLLSTEGQRRHFGSHVALTSDGEGIFIGCHSQVNPTEILFYRRKMHADVYGTRSFQLQQIITVSERCSISDFRVDRQQDNFVLGTLDSNCVYVYQQVHDLNTYENQGWRMVSKVNSSAPNIDKFGSSVGLFGDKVLVGSKNNVYSYSLEGWMAAASKNSGKKKKQQQQQSSSSRSNSSPKRGFMSSMSPLRFRR